MRSRTAEMQLVLWLALSFVLAGALVGCGGGPDLLGRYPELDAVEREAERVRLQELIAADHARLANWVAEPRLEQAPQLHDDAELRELVARLTASERTLTAYEEFETE